MHGCTCSFGLLMAPSLALAPFLHEGPCVPFQWVGPILRFWAQLRRRFGYAEAEPLLEILAEVRLCNIVHEQLQDVTNREILMRTICRANAGQLELWPETNADIV